MDAADSQNISPLADSNGAGPWGGICFEVKSDQRARFLGIPQSQGADHPLSTFGTSIAPSLSPLVS